MLEKLKKLLDKPIVVSVVLFVMYLAVVLGFGAVFSASDSDNGNWIATIIADALVGAVCLYVIIRTKAVGTDYKLPFKMSEIPLPAKITITVFLLVLVWILGIASSALDQSHGTSTAFQLNIPDSFLYMVLTLVTAPLCEEALFRGVIFNKLSRTKATIIGAAVLSSFLFAVLHGSQSGILAYFLFGMLLCCVYMMFGSLMPTMLVHCAYNGFMVVFNKMTIEASFSMLPIVMGLGIALMVVLGIVSYKAQLVSFNVADNEVPSFVNVEHRGKKPRPKKKDRASKKNKK